MNARLCFTCLVLLLVPFAAAAQSLTGVWTCDDGGTYWVHQVDSEVFWYGASADGAASWTHLFHGTFSGSSVSGDWADVPRGAELGAGDLALNIESADRFVATRQTGNFSGSVWTRTTAAAASKSSSRATRGGRSPENGASATGAWDCDDSGTYWLRQVGNVIWWYGESGDEGRSFTNMIRAVLDGNVMKGNWADVPYGQTLNSGYMELTFDSPNTFVATFKSSGFGGTHWVRANSRCATGAITLNAPADASTTNSPVPFSWSAIPGAVEYRLLVAVNGGQPAVAARTPDTSITIPLPSGAIDWQVEASFLNCPPIVSRQGSFNVAQAAGCDSHTAAEPLSPLSGAVANPVTLTWNASPGAIAYDVWASSAGRAFVEIGRTSETHIQQVLDEGAVQWYVVAWFEGCPPVTSQKASFQVPIGERCANAAPSIIAPADGAGGFESPVTFTWNGVPNADQYRIFAKSGTPDFVMLTQTAETSFTARISPGTTTWFVEAAFAACASTQSTYATFTIPEAASCPPNPAALISPANGATIPSPVEFTWSPVSGAVTYGLFVKGGNDAATLIAETAQTHFDQALSTGPVEWWITTFFKDCPSLESAHRTFAIAANPACDDNKAPVVFTPADGAEEVVSPVHFSWTPVGRATSYRVWSTAGGGQPAFIGETSGTSLEATVAEGRIRWYVEALFDACPNVRSAVSTFGATSAPPACTTPPRPEATVVGQAISGSEYSLRWNPLPNAGLFVVEESTTLDFTHAASSTVSGVSASFTHTAATPTQYLYRVRAFSSCSDERGPYSNIVGVFVIPPPTGSNSSASVEVGSRTNVVQTLFLAGAATPVSFTATVDKPWLTVTPSTGTLPPQGITLTVSSDPSALDVGTNTGTVTVSYGSSLTFGTNGGAPPTSVPVSVTLATPVLPGGNTAPLPNSLIIPAAGHTPGVNNAQFRSDLRLTNATARVMKYQINYTPSGGGARSGSSTTIQVGPGATTALDDVLVTLFGNGILTGATGMIEIRPLPAGGSQGSSTPDVQKAAVASSRTYTLTPSGTYGQFVPAIPFTQFIGKFTPDKVPAVLSLQQIAQSASYRTNLGLVEASFEPAAVMISVYDNANRLLLQIPQDLAPGEQRQLGSFLAANNVSLEDGRVEVAVTSTTGRVTAYASVIDNRTNDPLLVSPVLKSGVAADRYILPGVADINNVNANWRTDARIYNAGSQSTSATVTYVPQPNNAGAAAPLELQLAPGAIVVMDDVLGSRFNLKNSFGSFVITTPSLSSLIATARTYNQTAQGTYGQFIPGVTRADSVGLGGRAIQILQLEQSSRFRSNIGIVETSGSDAIVEVVLVLPDSTAAPVVRFPVPASGFRQISLADFSIGTAYNIRATVKVISGNGTVSAYGSVIDQVTQDPTYVPAQ